MVIAVGACQHEPEVHHPATPYDIRCAEDCGGEGAVYDHVTHEIAITGEDSWRCICRKGPDELVLW